MATINKIFKTHDQGLGAYLVLLGHPCIGAIPTEESFTNHLDEKRSKMEFVFIDVPSPAEIALEYMENKATGRLLEFHKNTQSLRWFLRNPMTLEEYKELKNG